MLDAILNRSSQSEAAAHAPLLCPVARTLNLSIFALVLAFALLANASEIHEAVRRGDSAKVAALLRDNPKLVNDTTDDDQSTPLHEAARRGDMDVAQVLFTAKANLNAKTTSGLTPLKLARGYGRTKLAAFLEANGAELLEPPPQPEPVIVFSPVAQPAALPFYRWPLRGDRELRIINSSKYMVTVRVISGLFGTHLRIVPGGSQSAWVSEGSYQLFYVFSDDPSALYEGDPVRVARNTASTSINLGVGRGNYSLRRVN